MQGHHKVRRFTVSRGTREIVLPTGWKPFAYENGDIIARKWVRDERPEHPA